MSGEQPMCLGSPGCGERHPEDFDCGQRWATEHQKIKSLKGENRVIGAFVDWLMDEEGWRICEPDGGGYWPVMLTREKILARYFGIDLKKLSAEKDRMVKEMQEAAER
jgi:hypothetical protein